MLTKENFQAIVFELRQVVAHPNLASAHRQALNRVLDTLFAPYVNGNKLWEISGRMMNHCAGLEGLFRVFDRQFGTASGDADAVIKLTEAECSNLCSALEIVINGLYGVQEELEEAVRAPQ